MSKSNIRYCRSKTDKELHQILELQQKNLFDNIPDKDRRHEGFVTEVDAKNIRSLNAHYAIGFKHLKSYNSVRQDWELIIPK